MNKIQYCSKIFVHLFGLHQCFLTIEGPSEGLRAPPGGLPGGKDFTRVGHKGCGSNSHIYRPELISYLLSTIAWR